MGRQYSAEFITQLSICKVGYRFGIVRHVTKRDLYPTLQISWSATNFTGSVTSCVNPTEAWYNGFTMANDTANENEIEIITTRTVRLNPMQVQAALTAWVLSTFPKIGSRESLTVDVEFESYFGEELDEATLENALSAVGAVVTFTSKGQ